MHKMQIPVEQSNQNLAIRQLKPFNTGLYGIEMHTVQTLKRFKVNCLNDFEYPLMTHNFHILLANSTMLSF